MTLIERYEEYTKQIVQTDKIINNQEPFQDTSVSNELMNRLTEFADSTLSLGETLLKKIDEININD